MKNVKLFEEFVNEGKKPEIEVSVSYARLAGDAFRDAYSKMGKMTSTNTFQFKNSEDAEDFAAYLMDYIEIPEEEITGYNLDESISYTVNENMRTLKGFLKAIRKEYGPTPTMQSLADFIYNNYEEITGDKLEDADPADNDHIADIVAYFKMDGEDFMIAWEDRTNEDK